MRKITLPAGCEPRTIETLALNVGKGQPYALLVDAAGAPALTVADAVGLVQIQVIVVERGAYAGEWLRFADRMQEDLYEFAGQHPELLVLDKTTLQKNGYALKGSNVRAMRCSHAHSEDSGWATSEVWGDLKRDPATGRTCWYCDNGYCVGRTRLNENRTYNVRHEHNDKTTCGEARAAWKQTPKQRLAAEQAKAEAEAEARAKEAAKEGAKAKRRANRRAKLEALANHEGTRPEEAEAAREALRRMDAQDAQAA